MDDGIAKTPSMFSIGIQHNVWCCYSGMSFPLALPLRQCTLTATPNRNTSFDAKLQLALMSELVCHLESKGRTLH